MAPRNNDASTSFKKKNFSGDPDSEMDVDAFLPCLLHKKHKVVKLVKCQMEKIRGDETLKSIRDAKTDSKVDKEDEIKLEKEEPTSSVLRRDVDTTENVREVRNNRPEKRFSWCSFLLHLLAVILLILFAVWMSVGPLSNNTARTPVSSSSLFTVDKLQSLEKKNLLRWSKPEYSE